MAVAGPRDIGWLLDRGRRARDEDGDPWAARRWFDAAYRAAASTGDAAAMGEAAIGSAGLWIREQHSTVAHTVLLDRLRRALVAVEPDDPLALRLRLRLTAEVEYGSGSCAATLALAEHAKSSVDGVARAEAISLVLQCLVGPGHAALRHGLAEQLIVDGVWRDHRGDVLMGMMWRVVTLLLDGDLRAERHLRELCSMLAERDHRAARMVVDAVDVMRRIRAGQFAHGEARADENLRQGRLAGVAGATETHTLQLVAIRWYQGRVGELAAKLRGVVEAPHPTPLLHAHLGAFAVAAAAGGEERQAHQALARLRGKAPDDLTPWGNWVVALYGAVAAAHLLHDRATAAEAYRLLLPYADRPATADRGAFCFGSVQHILGQAALVEGDLDEAITHLTAAVHDNVALGHWPAVVLARTRLAEALERRNRRADVERAAREREAASREATDIGLPPRDPATDHGHAGAAPHRRPPAATCRRRGRDWEVVVGDHRVRIADMRGMGYLAVLIGNPGQEIPAVQFAVDPGLGPIQAPMLDPAAGQAVVDDATRQRYRQRLADLAEHIEIHELNSDPGTADRLRGERQRMIHELAAAAGLAAHPQMSAGDKERARVAVGKAIRRTIDRVAEANLFVGEHLRNTVLTGTCCSYQPTIATLP